MEKFTLGRTKIGYHFYDFYGTETNYNKAMATKERLSAKGLVVNVRDQMQGKKRVWVIKTRRDRRVKKKPAPGKKPSKRPVKSGKNK